jgi:hypothetical protein
MKADHHGPAAGFHPAWQDRQEPIQGTQLIIDGDPQGLEHARRRIDRVPPAARARDRAANQISQLFRILQRCPPAYFDNLAGNPAAVAFLAVLPKEIGQVTFAKASEKNAGWLTMIGIHPHVKRTRLLKTETTLRNVDLVRADTEVGQHAIHSRDAELVQNLRQLIEVCLHKGDRVLFQASASQRKHGRVSVKTNEPAGRPQVLSQKLGMSAGAHGGVDDGLPRCRSQGLQYLGRQDRPMTG